MSERAECIAKRRQALFSSLEDAENACVLLPAGSAPWRNIPDVRYPYRVSSHFLFFSGLSAELSASVESAWLLLDASECCLFLQARGEYDALWHGAGPAQEELIAQGCLSAVHTESKLPAFLKRYRTQYALGLPQQQAEGLSLSVENAQMLTEAIISLRLIHDAFGVEQLANAAELSAVLFSEWCAQRTAFKSEREAASFLEHLAHTHGAQMSFPSIVTQQPAVLHASPSLAKLAQSDCLLIDFGVELESGYCSDCTRVLPQNPLLQRQDCLSAFWDFYEGMLQLQEQCIAATKPGVSFLEVQIEAERALVSLLVDLGVLKGALDELFEKGIASSFFPHGVGHPIGLDVHDMQDLGEQVGYPGALQRAEQFGRCYLRFNRVLEDNMALTVEPGCYFSPLLLDTLLADSQKRAFIDHRRLDLFRSFGGIRLEDMVLVADTPRVLSRSLPKTRADIMELCQ